MVRGAKARCLGRRVAAGCAALPLVALTSGPAAGSGTTASAPSDDDAAGGLDPRITAIMHKPEYRHARWDLLETDPAGGRAVHSLSPETFFIPGSTAKLFVVSGTWRTLGADHRFVTPLYAVGERRGSTLTGDLDLVAQGDLTMGGRTAPDGTVAYTDLDHTPSPTTWP
ncbi:D-alanyl-D-alanine carboxypeptidase [Streptomyces sp. AB3(2024)]|uniref:D-alanyl-D-alanine carboxypeptidase n=1 Tax=Streptomyces sp. AB3(2024) TaxID=3317321 RepID=UPI0035A39299